MVTIENEDDVRSVSFREKFSWVMAVATLAAIGVVIWILWSTTGLEPDVMRFPVIAAIIFAGLVQLAIIIIGSIGSALSSLDSANDPIDERDRVLGYRASFPALAVTQLGIGLSLAAFAFGFGIGVFILGSIMTLMLGELVRQVQLIRLYRRAA